MNTYWLRIIAFVSVCLISNLITFAHGTSALWIAESEGVLKVATADGSILFEIPNAGGVDLVAVNEADGVVWTFGQQRLRAYSANGVLQIDASVDIGHRKASNMVVDANGLWLAAGRRVFQFNLVGELQHTVRFRRTISSITLDTQRSQLWVASRARVFILDNNANEVQRFWTYFPFIAQLEYDAHLDATWAVVGPFLLRLNANNLHLELLSQFGVGFKLHKHLAADGQGGVWGSAGRKLHHVTETGLLDVNLKPFHGYHNRIKDIVADNQDASAWVANKTTLKHFDIVGSLQQTLQPDLGDGVIRRINRLAISEETDTQAPILNITSPLDGSLLNNNTPTIELSYSSNGTIDTDSIQISENNNPLSINCSADQTTAQCDLNNALLDGAHTLTATIADTNNNVSDPVSVNFTIDTTLPVITITSPVDSLITNNQNLTITGNISEATQSLTLDFNGNVSTLTTDGNNNFNQSVSLIEGANSITISATDLAGNTNNVIRTTTLDTQAPSTPDANLINVSDPDNGQVTITGSDNSVEPNSEVSVTNTQTGETITTTADANGAFTLIINAQDGDTLQINTTDTAGNDSDAIELTVLDLPPNPETIAPPLDPTQSTSLIDATEFLYTGNDPIQTGVNPNTFEPTQVAVIRGQVKDKQNNPLPGVIITIKDHPEYGQTKTRADGLFDMVVNGGGLMIVNYQRDGFLPVQRQVNTRWQDYGFADDVVMIALDNQVTTIDLNNPNMQVAQGSAQTDVDGTRQATVLFPQGTTASMLMPNGTTQAISTLNVRATEYTVGENGPETMPAALPPTSAYTYAVELSVDEAIAASATRVDFSQPVPVYVDNFLDFPIGEVVPVGFYDRLQSAWVSMNNGRVIVVLNNQNNTVELDVDGTGNPATPTQLNELGITTAELEQLANLYQASDSLWRVQIDHFTPFDLNWPFAAPADAEAPPASESKTPEDNTPLPEDSDCRPGCTIQVQSQTMSEDIPIVGTPFSLNYRSDRALGRRTNYVLDIPLSESTVPSSLQAIRLNIAIAGREFDFDFPATPNQTHQFIWDGLDVYGRTVVGQQVAFIKIDYVYNPVYVGGAQDFGNQGFALSGDTDGVDFRPISNGTRQEFVISRFWQKRLGNFIVNESGIANLNLNIHHTYRFAERTLYLGNGDKRDAKNLLVLNTIAGNGSAGFSGDGSLATDAELNLPNGVTVDSLGQVYIADFINDRIRRVDQSGIIDTVVGFNNPQDIAVSTDGSIYVSENSNCRVHKINTDGSTEFVAGAGCNDSLPSLDGIPATSEVMGVIQGIALTTDGTLYIANRGRIKIRRVAPNGIITTIAGDGTRCALSTNSCGDGGPATEAQLMEPNDVAVGPDGSIYILDTQARKVRRVRPDGIIETVAGNGTNTFTGDGGLASESGLGTPTKLAVDFDGNLYIASVTRIFKITADGILRTIVGDGEGTSSGGSNDGELAIEANIFLSDVAVDPNGQVYFSDPTTNKVMNAVPVLAGLNPDDTVIASRNGELLYVFDSLGNHLRTVNTLTGVSEFEFIYDSNGLLISVVDKDNDITTIERNALGEPTAIISADGQRTEFTLDANGYLATVTNPANEVYQMTYTVDGLMTQFRDRKNQPNNFQYDALGRLIDDVNAGNGGWAINRVENTNGYTVAMTTAEGRTSNFTVESLANGDRRQLVESPDNTTQEILFTTNGQEITTQADGTITTLQEGSDPRFSLQSPIPESLTIATPSGLTLTTIMDRSVTLSDNSDPLSLLTQTETITANGKIFTSQYDAISRTFTNTTAEGRTSTEVIDGQNRLLQTHVSGLASIDYTYDTRGRLTAFTEGQGTDARITNMSYYPSGSTQAGFLQSINDAENRTVQFEYDNTGRVTKQILPDNREINYGYDANGNLTSITPPGRSVHIFNYNAFDLEDEYIPPTVGGISTLQTIYDYNLDRELAKITRPDGGIINLNYNAQGQFTSMMIPRGNYTYSYSAITGQLTEITAPQGGTLTFSYDGFLRTGITWVGDVSGNIIQTFNNDFRVSSRSINGGNTINFSYDDDKLLTQAGLLTINRDNQKAGFITGTILGDTTTVHVYNSFGELTDFDANYNATQLYEVDYIRDNIGRVTQETETIEGVATTENYSYDLAGRLETVNRNGQVTTYTYDANGNRLSKTQGVLIENGTYDDQDRLLSYNNFTYTYNDNGELESKTNTSANETTSYNYDVLGNLISVILPNSDIIEYIIDGQNRRIGKKLNGNLQQGFLYAAQLNPIAELDSNNNVISRFIYGDKSNVPAYMVKNGVAYRIISDHSGSPRLVINTVDGNITQRIDYDEFGNVTNDTNPGFQPFGFVGGIYDIDTGLVRFGERDYDALIGRWASKDPIKFLGGDLNLYNYVLNDPVNLIDPFGLAYLETDLANGTTTFNPVPYRADIVTIPTRNDVTTNALPGADGPFTTPDVNWIPNGTDSNAFGPDGAYIDTGDSRGRDIHGGGSKLADPKAPRQGFVPTLGCTRGQNEDVQKLGKAIADFKKKFPGVPIPYIRK